jgi:SulP family sulfate permease
MFSSPRRGHLNTVATTTLRDHHASRPEHKTWSSYAQPLQLILQTFTPLCSKPESFWKPCAPLFKRQIFPTGHVLYRRGDAADGFFLLESGILRAEYVLPQGSFSELIVGGTTCGELPFFSESVRTSTTTAERECVVWALGKEDWEKCQAGMPEVARELLLVALKLTSERMESITKYMLVTGT